MVEEIISQSKVKCVFSPSPLNSEGRIIITSPPSGDESINDYIKRVKLPVKLGHYYTLRINGTTIPKNWWSRVYPKPNSFMTITATFRGGVAKIIGAIAIAVVAPYLAPVLLGAIGIAATATALSIASAVLTIGGTLILGAIFSPQVPGGNASISQRSNTNDIVSPTYSIAGGRNSTRGYQPFLLVLGSHIVFPDFGSIPFVQFEGDNQYLYQIYEFGIAATTSIKLSGCD